MTNLVDGWAPASLDTGTITFASDATRGNVANFASADFFTPYPIPPSYSVCLWFTVGATNNFAWAFVTYSGAHADNTTFMVGISAPSNPATGTLMQTRVKQFNTALVDVTNYQMPSFALNTWYHACYTWDTNTKVASNYFNGNLVASDTFPGEPWTGANGTLRVGAGNDLGYPYIGQIQGLAIWNASITDQQVARVYSQQNGVNQVSQLALYL